MNGRWCGSWWGAAHALVDELAALHTEQGVTRPACRSTATGFGHYWTDQPPSDGRTAPLMLMPSSLSRKVMEAASCSAVARLGIACWKGASRAEPVGDTCAGMGMPVATPPGATALTRMPCGPYMKAADLVRPRTPCLETVYAVPEELPRSAASEATLTIEPAPAAIMSGRTARDSLKPPVRLMPMTRSRFVRGLVDRREIVVHAGHVRQGVDAAVGCHDDPVDVTLQCDVTEDGGDRAVGEGRREGLEALGRDVHSDHAATFPRDARGGCPADAGCRAGDDDGLAVEPSGRDALGPHARGALLGRYDPVVDLQHQIIDDRLRQLPLADGDELPERERADGGEHLLRYPGLVQQPLDERRAFRVGQPCVDGAVRGELGRGSVHVVRSFCAGVRQRVLKRFKIPRRAIEVHGGGARSRERRERGKASVVRGVARLSPVQAAPAATQRERGRLRLAVAGEHALLVAVDAVDAGGGLEVGEVPDVFADELGDAVETRWYMAR